MKEHVYAKDPNVSLKALDQTWKLEGAYTEKHVHAHITYADMCKELSELEQERKELEKELARDGDASTVIEGQFLPQNA